MKLTVKRIAFKPTYTIGRLYIDGEYFCDTLEDPPREIKIINETCIPAGKYQVVITMSNRFQRLMPLLLNVPGFDGIRIHAGNTAANTSGCLLVGKNKIVGQLVESRATFDELFAILQKSTERITIEIS